MKLLEALGKFMLVLLVPFLVVITAIRILFNPIFLQAEYNTPNFPPDPYGFSLQDRLKYSAISLNFLQNDDSIETLAKVTLPDGITPLYNQRELSHMIDVKNLLKRALAVHTILALIALAALALAWRLKKIPEYFQLLARGGWVTIGLIVLVMAGVALSFDWLFTQFHELFFTGDSWLFLYSDSFIRLFPIQFWQDGFIWLGVISISMSLFLVVLGHYVRRQGLK